MLHRTCCSKHVAHNILPETCWSECLAENMLDKICCLEYVNLKYVAQNTLLRPCCTVHCSEHVTQNMLLGICYPEFVTKNMLLKTCCSKHAAQNMLLKTCCKHIAKRDWSEHPASSVHVAKNILLNNTLFWIHVELFCKIYCSQHVAFNMFLRKKKQVSWNILLKKFCTTYCSEPYNWSAGKSLYIFLVLV